ncbi:MAG: class I SAM-dependent methyltransferase [Campylobacterota bacterium]|nr:class I SAM-dependent methyltransferase [Campylobacterota bacterium]
MKEENFFETMYQNASDDLGSIPWATMSPNVYLLEYLEEAEDVNGKRALVIGCGLGDDAVVLAKKGYATDAIDISSTAIEMAKKRFGESGVHFSVQDIFVLPEDFNEAYDFVYEGLTIQSLPREQRQLVVDIISGLVTEGGKLFVYAHGQEDEDNYGGPPWPLYSHEFDLFLSKGFKVVYSKQEEEKKPVAPHVCCVLYEK